MRLPGRAALALVALTSTATIGLSVLQSGAAGAQTSLPPPTTTPTTPVTRPTTAPPTTLPPQTTQLTVPTTTKSTATPTTPHPTALPTTPPVRATPPPRTTTKPTAPPTTRRRTGTTAPAATTTPTTVPTTVESTTTTTAPTTTTPATTTPTTLPPATTVATRDFKVDRPSAEPGGEVNASGEGCDPGAAVAIEIGGARVADATAGSDGRFSAPLDLPVLQPGRFDVVAHCGPTLDTTIDIVLASRVDPGTSTLAVLVFFVLLLLALLRGRRYFDKLSDR